MEHNNNRDISLDLIKVIATVFVVKLHCGVDGFVSEIIHNVAGVAIPLFLMVSGALILNKEQDFKYYGKKIINVFIIMGMWCILLAVGKSVLSRKMESPLKYAFGAMTQQGILSHFWYLWMLVIMYLIVPILLYLRKKGMIAWTNLVLLLLCVVMSSNTLLLGKMVLNQIYLSFYESGLM